MLLRFQQPALPLRPFIQHYMVAHVRYDAVPAQAAVKPMPPAPQHALYFYPRDEVRTFHYGQQREIRSARSIVVGPQVSRVDLQFSPNHLVVCVAFWPGGLHRLLGVPVQELFDFAADSRALLGPEIDEIDARLTETDDYAAMLATVETYLLRRLRALHRPTRPIDAMLTRLVTAPKIPSVDRQAYDSCLSSRQFERSFRERVGMSPKLYARIVRFDRAFRLKERQPGLDWLAVATHTGYFDYRHLVRDFKEFAGVTPPLLLAAEAAHTQAARSKNVGFLLPAG